MTIRVTTLDSALPHSGTKPFDHEIDVMRTHYLCEGRLPHDEHDADDYPNGVVELVGTDVQINPSTWLVDVRRDGNVGAYEEFRVTFQVLAAELIPTGGVAGTVIAKVFYAPVQPGAVTSTAGDLEGQLQFVPGANLTDAAIDAICAPDFWVRVADFVPTGAATPPNVALGATATASSSSPLWVPSRLTDGLNNFWTNDPIADPFGTSDIIVTIDLGSAVTVDQFEVDWLNATYASNLFDLSCSTDNITFTPVVSGDIQGFNGGQATGTFPPQTCQYWQFVFKAGSGHPTTLIIQEIRLFEDIPEGITQGPLAKICTRGSGICLDGGSIDMGGGCIRNLCPAVNGTDAVTLDQVTALLGSGGGGNLHLEGTRGGLGLPRELEWDNYLTTGAGVYEILTLDHTSLTPSWTVLATVSATTNTYTDGSLSASPDICYRVRAYDPATGVSTWSNIVQFSGGTLGQFACGEYGLGSDGAYTGGNLLAGRIYQFTTFDLSSSIQITGQGDTIILVQGDLNILSGAITLDYSNAVNLPTLDVCGTTRSLAKSPVVVKVGGLEGLGGQPACPGQPVGRRGGKGGNTSAVRSMVGQAGYVSVDGGYAGGPAGNPGVVGVPAGQDGQPGTQTFVVDGTLSAPGGGGAGGHGMCRANLVFIVGGNVTIDSTSTLVGFGARGGDGGAGGIGAINSFGQGAPGGGGGGAGGQGGDGSRILVYYPAANTATATPILQLQGGVGGSGGLDGAGGVSSSNSPSCGTPQVAPSGYAGDDGDDGQTGTLELIPV